MLISHKYKFIFIKTVKTAGTSIEVDLSQLLDENDVVTRIRPPEPGHRERNFVVNGVKMTNHNPATLVRQTLGEDVFSEYTKFCVEREPVDKCISHFSMMINSPIHQGQNQNLTWEKYLKRADFPMDHRKYLDKNGDCMVDHILKYENLNDELMALMSKLGVPFAGFKARAKGGYREKTITFDTVSPAEKKKIYRKFSKSLKFTGYQLPA